MNMLYQNILQLTKIIDYKNKYSIGNYLIITEYYLKK